MSCPIQCESWTLSGSLLNMSFTLNKCEWCLCMHGFLGRFFFFFFYISCIWVTTKFSSRIIISHLTLAVLNLKASGHSHNTSCTSATTASHMIYDSLDWCKPPVFQVRVTRMWNSSSMKRRCTKAKWSIRISTQPGMSFSPSPSVTYKRNCTSRYLQIL